MLENNFLWLILHLMPTSRCQALPVEESCSQLGQCIWISHFWGSINYEDMEYLPFNKHSFAIRASQVVVVVKNPPANAENVRNVGSVPELGRSPGGGHATHSSILAWRIPWTERPVGLQSMGSQSRTRLKWLSTHVRMLVCIRSSQAPDLSLPPHSPFGNYMFVLGVCKSVSVLWINSFVSFFKIRFHIEVVSCGDSLCLMAVVPLLSPLVLSNTL